MDLPDVIAMCVALLDPFAATGAADATDASGANVLAMDEYRPLRLELGDFRAAP
jgi:hypothetical protein